MSDLQRKKRYYQNRMLDPVLVAYYFSEFGHVQKVLDIGCGNGELGEFKPNPAIEVYGLDIDEDAVKKAQKYEYAQVSDLECDRIPFTEGYFDAVLAKDILEHIQKPWILVSEIYRILKIGGVVIANVPMAKPKVVWNDYTHIRGFTADALKMLFEDNRFEILHIKKMGGVPLAGKLKLVKWIPSILKIPPMDLLFGACHEIKAQKPVRRGITYG